MRKVLAGRTLWLCTTLFVISALLLPAVSVAQNYAYVNNRTSTGNTISAFAVDTGGVVTTVPGSPYATGGTGANILCSAIDRITVSPSRNLLFVTNSGDQTVSVFQIAPATGVLTAVPGSPFATGLALDSCAGMSLAPTPNGNFLMVSSNGTIKTFSVAVNGALSLASSVSGLPTPMVGMKISGNGQFLAVSHQSAVSVFTIAADGSLTAVAGSPFAKTGTGLVGGLEFNCDGTLLYAGEGGGTSSITDIWNVAATGALSPVLGSPVSATGSDSNIVFLTPDNTMLFQSNQGSNNLNSFTVNADGTLTSIGLFGGAGQTNLPAGLASDNSGLFLYAADDAFGLAVFNILPGVVPTLVADTAITGAGQIQGVAAYPPRSCAHTDFSITQSASPNPVAAGSQITYSITVTNNGPSTASVAINDLLPRANMTFGSCTPGPGGVCDKGAGLNRTITFASLASGQSGTATLVGNVISTLLNGDTISNTATVSNSSAVDPNPANNASTTNVTVNAPLSASKFVVANATGSYFGTVNLSATLTRVLNGAAVAGRTVTFSLNGAVMGTGVTSASGIATLSNVSLAGINAGIYPGGVSANFAGDSQFSSTSGSATLTINKLPLTVTTQNASRFFGDPNPAFTNVITGFVNNETTALVGGAPNCSTSASASSPPNGYTMACSTGTLSATNYSFVFVNAILTVNPAPLVLAGNSVSRLYGDANPALTGTVTGLKNGNQATATFSTTAVATSPVGIYPMIGVVVPGSGFVATNYSVSSTGTVTVSPAPLTATANNATRVYGDPNPAFTGTVTGVKNGDAVTATFASVADPTSPVGTYPITATLSGAPAVISNYTVSATGATLTITPAALSVAAANSSRLYGDANPAFSGTIAGIKNADNITAIYASVATAASSVGTYPIIPTLVDPAAKLGNYTVTSSNGTLTVGPAPLSVAAANAARLYGDPNPVFTGTITGIKNADNITATYASVADPTSAVGTFAIVATLADPTLKLSNYTVTATNGVLTVNPAPLSVTATNATRLYGDANPAFTGTITGIKNGDNITATFSSAATATSAVGSYPIISALADPTAKLGNYTVTSSNGTLTVSPATLTVTAANASRLYGDPNPAFTGTITGIKNSDNITATFDSLATAASAVGTYPITATLADPTSKLANYSVVSNNGSLAVNPAALTVSATDASRGYGDPNPAFTGRITGVKNGDNITATFVSAATAASSVGTYPITPNLADPTNKLGNYVVTANNGTLTITAVPLSVSAANASRVYGDPNPAFTGTITGIKNGDNITAAFTSADVTAGVGTYPIVATLADPTGKLGNYIVTSSNGVLTVTPAALSVSAASASRLYGDANPVFTGVIAGIKNADNITATYASAATAASNIGTYAIMPTLLDPGAKLGNYVVTSNNGTLTIGQASLTVTAANASRVFGNANPAFTGTIAGIKNSDGITATFASAATAASPAGTYPIVPTLVDPAGKLPNYSVTTNNGILTVIGLPVPLSVTPSTGTATSAVFSATYTDPSGAGALTDTYMLINDVLVYACGVRYHPATNQVFLINEAGTAWQPAVTLGSAAVLQNSKCSLNAAASSASISGSNVTVNFSISFSSTFVGVKNIYLRAQDTRDNLISPWTQLGTWSLPAPIPAVVSVTPNAGTSTNQIFSAVYSDAAGADKITDGYLLVNDVVVWTCGVRYHPATRQLFMINEAGTAFQTPITIGTNATLQNSKCTLDGATSSALVSGNNLTVNFSLSFSANYLGKKNIYLRAADTKNNLQSPWTQVGTWTLATPIPSVVSVTPSAGSGSSAIFSAVYSDTGGAATLTDAYLLVNDVVVWTCGVRYHPATNQLFMINEAGTAFQPPVTMGTAATLQNSKCILDAATSSASVSGNNLTVNFSIQFQPGFTGPKNVYLRALDSKNNLQSAWTQVGTWTLP